MTEREEKEARLKDAIVKSLILSAEDRDFWLSHAGFLPNVVLENVTGIIESKNKIMEDYIQAELKNDPDHNYLTQLKTKIQEIKKKAFSMNEEKEKEGAEEGLNKLLDNL